VPSTVKAAVTTVARSSSATVPSDALVIVMTAITPMATTTRPPAPESRCSSSRMMATYLLPILARNGRRFSTKAFSGLAEFGSLCP
jgi:hypothetical protein